MYVELYHLIGLYHSIRCLDSDGIGGLNCLQLDVAQIRTLDAMEACATINSELPSWGGRKNTVISTLSFAKSFLPRAWEKKTLELILVVDSNVRLFTFVGYFQHLDGRLLYCRSLVHVR